MHGTYWLYLETMLNWRDIPDKYKSAGWWKPLVMWIIKGYFENNIVHVYNILKLVTRHILYIEPNIILKDVCISTLRWFNKHIFWSCFMRLLLYCLQDIVWAYLYLKSQRKILWNKLFVQGEIPIQLHVHAPAICQCPCCMSLSMLLVQIHSAWAWTCSRNMTCSKTWTCSMEIVCSTYWDMQYGHGHPAWTWTWTLDKQHVLVHAACPCPKLMSISMLHVQGEFKIKLKN